MSVVLFTFPLASFYCLLPLDVVYQIDSVIQKASKLYWHNGYLACLLDVDRLNASLL